MAENETPEVSMLDELIDAIVEAPYAKGPGSIQYRVDGAVAALKEYLESPERHQTCNDQIKMLTEANFSLQRALQDMEDRLNKIDDEA